MKKLFLLVLFIALICCQKKSSGEQKNNSVSSEKVTSKIKYLLAYKYIDTALQNFYKKAKYRNVWLSVNNRKTVLDELEKSYEEGLSVLDYDIDKLKKFEEKIKIMEADEVAEYDVLLTKNLRKYMINSSYGHLSPNLLYGNYEIRPNYFDINQIIERGLRTNLLKAKIDEIKPNHPVYLKLKNALKIINSLPEDNFKEFYVDGILKPFNADPVMIDIKKRLIYWKDMEPTKNLSVIYDQQTMKAINKFKKRHGLYPNSIIDAETIMALNFSKQQRKEQIIANLERWRWYPRDFGDTYIIVNIPEYKLTFVRYQDTVAVHKVIVGKPERETPVLTSTFSVAVFNPTWTVPPTILDNDLIPEMRLNNNHLTNSGISLYDRHGNPVNVKLWDSAKAKQYRYVQNSGMDNTLGVIKFIFPNRFFVYLHDTKHKGAFNGRNLALSSGCVRVESPLKLTENLFDDPLKWYPSKIDKIIKENKTKEVRLPKNIGINLLYWTAWSEGNQLIFRPDIYSKDADLYYYFSLL